MANPTSRTQIVNAITNLITTYNYDGIDLDFEGFAFVDKNTTWSATKPHWIAFVKELSGVLKSKNKLLSVSTPYLYDPAGAQKGYFVYAWADIAPYIDRLRIMTYDYSVAKPGPIGPLAWTERTIKYAVSIMLHQRCMSEFLDMDEIGLLKLKERVLLKLPRLCEWVQKQQHLYCEMQQRLHRVMAQFLCTTKLLEK
jgi:spore germination protein YaaH